MTYKSRGRSMVEVMIAAIFVGFLTGFVAVLCIGNYFRAKRAMERQRQRRIARLASGGGNGGIIDSPGSSNTSSGSHRSPTNTNSTPVADEQQHLLSSSSSRGGGGFQSRTARRNNNHINNNNLNDWDEGEEVTMGTESLLLQVDDEKQVVDLMSV